MLQLNEKTRVHAFWFVPHFDEQGEADADWLGCIFAQEGDVKWRAIYRFRYYNDQVAHDSTDDKQWYTVESRDQSEVSLKELAVLMDSIAKMLAGDMPSIVKKVVIDGTGADAIEKLAELNFVHIREEERPN
jgi:hypothetical protein